MAIFHMRVTSSGVYIILEYCSILSEGSKEKNISLLNSGINLIASKQLGRWDENCDAIGMIRA
jgi:hypothetical protein